MSILNKIEQEYTPYWTWECYKNGMWEKVDKNTFSCMLDEAINFTSDHIKYGSAMIEVSEIWENTMINHLTNPSINQKAFIGHCAVSYKLGIPEYITRAAWKKLTKEQQILANMEAEKAIKKWKIQYIKKLESMKKLGLKGATPKVFQMKLQIQ